MANPIENNEKKNVPQKTYEYVFDYFSDKILNGELQLNDKIAPEREISEQLAVSRNSVREVMHMLEITGLIECVQGSGNYVKCDTEDYMVRSVQMVMSLMNIQYSDVFQLRIGFELVALRQAIQCASKEEVEAVYEALINMENTEDVTERGIWDTEFHKRLNQASHNKLLGLFTSMVKGLMDIYIKDYHGKIMQDSSRYAALMRSHWNIYEALVSKDYAAGSMAMTKHFEIVQEQMNNLS